MQKERIGTLEAEIICSMRREQIKKGQLVKLSEGHGRWSNFVDTSQLGIVVDHPQTGLVKVLFTDGHLQEHWYFSLETLNESR